MTWPANRHLSRATRSDLVGVSPDRQRLDLGSLAWACNWVCLRACCLVDVWGPDRVAGLLWLSSGAPVAAAIGAGGLCSCLSGGGVLVSAVIFALLMADAITALETGPPTSAHCCWSPYCSLQRCGIQVVVAAVRHAGILCPPPTLSASDGKPVIFGRAFGSWMAGIDLAFPRRAGFHASPPLRRRNTAGAQFSSTIPSPRQCSADDTRCRVGSGATCPVHVALD